MKIKDGFWLREVGGTYVAVALGSAARDFHGIVNLNASGAFLFSLLKEGADKEALVAALLDRYEVDEATARSSVDTYLAQLQAAELLEA